MDEALLELKHLKNLVNIGEKNLVTAAQEVLKCLQMSFHGGDTLFSCKVEIMHFECRRCAASKEGVTVKR